jgi:hypothetical protein
VLQTKANRETLVTAGFGGFRWGDREWFGHGSEADVVSRGMRRLNEGFDWESGCNQEQEALPRCELRDPKTTLSPSKGSAKEEPTEDTWELTQKTTCSFTLSPRKQCCSHEATELIASQEKGLPMTPYV